MIPSYNFVKGEMVKCDPPGWFAKATAEDDAWTALLGKADAVLVNDFGGESGGDSLQIYRRGAEEYLIVIRDAHQVIMTVFIDDVADYILFRAKQISSLATLIMEEERHYEWQWSRKLKRAS